MTWESIRVCTKWTMARAADNLPSVSEWLYGDIDSKIWGYHFTLYAHHYCKADTNLSST